MQMPSRSSQLSLRGEEEKSGVQNQPSQPALFMAASTMSHHSRMEVEEAFFPDTLNSAKHESSKVFSICEAKLQIGKSY
jgi:hypothetical protein